MRNVAILGAGSWGTALAVHLERAGREVHLWARDSEVAGNLARTRVNTTYLPGISVPERVRVTDSLQTALREVDLVVSAIRSHGCRDVMRKARPYLYPRATIVSATKGIESGTLRRMSEVIGEEIGASHPVVVLSGPSFAIE